ncbi:MAG: S41 family peptidase, partial [Planctomycetota bacterium]
PLIVLLNGHSASASEVVAGALQDHRRALLVGERTYGKFLVQQITAIPGRDAALQLTTSRYYLPSGRSYQRQKTNGNGRSANGKHRPAAGILPDVVVPLEKEQQDRLEKAFANEEAGPWNEEPPFPDVPGDEMDPQLQRALDLLQGELVLRKIRSSR